MPLPSALRNFPRNSLRLPPRAEPPEVNRIDHQIHLRNGSASVLEYSRHRVQLTKQNECPNLSARVEELTRDLGYLRQETQFYRQSFENLYRLRETGYDVYQQLFLALSLDQNPDCLHDIMMQLHRGLQESVRCETKAEKVWMEFWGMKYNGKEIEREVWV
ncbi:hypothetical protein F5884DRAFT_811821 [Xylogone sp. PMI_703]|nr:hypothetical protein F5884DRAFT_811821 [Xylogone sp. PMI_703]